MRGAALLTALGLATLSSAAAHERITTTVTWDREISAIVQARCVTCHREGGRAPMSLATWADARPWARAIRHEVLTRRMPRWQAARGHGDFANDPSLSPFEIALVVAWVDGGAPRTFVPRGVAAPRVESAPAEQPLQPPAAADSPQTGAHTSAEVVTVACGDQPAPEGVLLGLRPRLTPGASLRVVAQLPSGREEVLGWFHSAPVDDETTYWLRSPLRTPRGARLRMARPSTPCTLDLWTSRAPGRG